MLSFRSFTLSAAIIAFGAVCASAQPVISAKAGTIAKAEGKVYLGDQIVEESLTKFPDIKENGVVRTEDGRAEVLLTPGTVLHLGENSSFRLITNRLIDTRLELLTGSATIDAEQIAKDTGLTVVCKDATISVSKAGHYRLDVNPARLKVFEGTAEVALGAQHVAVTSGKMMSLAGDVALVEKFDKNDTDSLDNWARRRGEIMALANVSAAKSLYSSYSGYSTMGAGGMWSWNPYFGLYTYIPGSGRFCDPFYGYCYWSPSTVIRAYYQPPPMIYNNGGGGFSPSYTAMTPTSGGYSGTMASSSSSVSAAPAAAAASSAAASSAGAASAGHGSGGGGGRH